MNGQNNIIKKIGLIVCFLLLVVSGLLADRLEIHHINVNNGDATVIAIIEEGGNELVKVLIDGGQSDPNVYLLPYIEDKFDNSTFDLVILTHYHNDHYKGLLALEDGRIRGKWLVDPGGYDLTQVDPSCDPKKLVNIQPKDYAAGWQVDSYLTAIKTAALNYGLKRLPGMNPESGQESTMINLAITLATVNGVKIRLRCVTYWGYVLSSPGVKDVWTKTGDKSANNATIAFVLECGEFRYFLGGDMGGENTSSYIDMETPLSAGFQRCFKNAVSFNPNDHTVYNGHICGFKASHHGSNESNNSTILGMMKPAVCVTSAGNHTGWKLPSVGFITRLNNTRPLTTGTPSFGASLQGFYFTNLYNFGGQNNSRNVANHFFMNNTKHINYNYGAMGYMVEVLLMDDSILNESTFYIWKVGDEMNDLLTTVKCHKKKTN